MPPFEPFRGVRYDEERVHTGDVVAPPYDVINDEERAELAARSPHNAVRIELPVDEGGVDRYAVACRLFQEWRATGVLRRDEEPAFYLYRMGFRDDAGTMRQTSGVIGALELSAPTEGAVLPHEQTTPKARSDRLEMLRSCRANLSPIWGLSSAAGLSALCEPMGPPVARATDDLGVHHRLWPVISAGIVEAITETVASEPVVIADGHHRYETALAFRDERRAAGDGAGPWDAVMALVVELTESQLAVAPIHRLLSGLPDGLDLVDALRAWFDLFETSRPDATMADRMADAGALAVVTDAGTWLARPRPEALAGVRDLDSSRLDVALAGLAPHQLSFQHGIDHVVSAVARGQAQAGVLLRPATVDQIAAIAHGGERMPPKTTYFHPKPRTGFVFRSLEDGG